jgi:hypothetical protein
MAEVATDIVRHLREIAICDLVEAAIGTVGTNGIASER